MSPIYTSDLKASYQSSLQDPDNLIRNKGNTRYSSNLASLNKRKPKSKKPSTRGMFVETLRQQCMNTVAGGSRHYEMPRVGQNNDNFGQIATAWEQRVVPQTPTKVVVSSSTSSSSPVSFRSSSTSSTLATSILSQECSVSFQVPSREVAKSLLEDFIYTQNSQDREEVVLEATLNLRGLSPSATSAVPPAPKSKAGSNLKDFRESRSNATIEDQEDTLEQLFDSIEQWIDFTEPITAEEPIQNRISADSQRLLEAAAIAATADPLDGPQDLILNRPRYWLPEEVKSEGCLTLPVPQCLSDNEHHSDLKDWFDEEWCRIKDDIPRLEKLPIQPSLASLLSARDSNTNSLHDTLTIESKLAGTSKNSNTLAIGDKLLHNKQLKPEEYPTPPSVKFKSSKSSTKCKVHDRVASGSSCANDQGFTDEHITLKGSKRMQQSIERLRNLQDQFDQLKQKRVFSNEGVQSIFKQGGRNELGSGELAEAVAHYQSLESKCSLVSNAEDYRKESHTLSSTSTTRRCHSSADYTEKRPALKRLAETRKRRERRYVPSSHEPITGAPPTGNMVRLAPTSKPDMEVSWPFSLPRPQIAAWALGESPRYSELASRGFRSTGSCP